MKNTQYIIAVLICALFAGCMHNEDVAGEVQGVPVESEQISEVKPTAEIQEEELPEEDSVKDDGVEVEAQTKTISSADIQGAIDVYAFTAEIPVDWEVEYIPQIDAINIYNPAVADDSALEQSQIFIRYFSANAFLTLSTVTIYNREELEINSRPATVYDIEKKAGVADFASQPSWRNARHMVTDIRSSDANPAIFYVFAKRPELDQEAFDAFIQSVQFQ